MFDELLIGISGAIAAVLMVAGFRRLLLSYAASRLYRPAPQGQHRPDIWIICACRNEARQLPRLIESLVALRYRGTHRIVLIDDWSNDTSPALMTAATKDRPDDFHAVLLSGRQRGKADALRDGLAQIPIGPEDILLVIDADHRLRHDALDNLANYFADPETAAVAIEHPVDRPARSLISAYCWIEAAIGEVVTSRGQHALGLPPKLAGSWACRSPLFDRLFPSGWQLADDTVFTARIIAEGSHIAYAADVVTLQDVPDTLKGYLAQHLRWSAGYAESAGRSLSARSRNTGLLQRIDSIATHAGYFERPLLALLLLLALVGLIAGTNVPLGITAGVIVGYALIVLIQIVTALRLSGADWKLAGMSFASLPMMAVDMVISIRGIATGLRGRRVAWATDHRG